MSGAKLVCRARGFRAPRAIDRAGVVAFFTQQVLNMSHVDGARVDGCSGTARACHIRFAASQETVQKTGGSLSFEYIADAERAQETRIELSRGRKSVSSLIGAH